MKTAAPITAIEVEHVGLRVHGWTDLHPCCSHQRYIYRLFMSVCKVAEYYNCSLCQHL